MELEKLKFNLQEIPEGESFRDISLAPDDVPFEGELELKSGDLSVRFYRTEQFIELKFNVTVLVTLVCDRSLRKFDKHVEGSYHLLYEPGPVEESESEKSAIRQISAQDPVLDIRKEVADTIILQIPIKNVHPDYLDESGNIIDFDMKTYGPPSSGGDQIDPRWAALKKLKQIK